MAQLLTRVLAIQEEQMETNDQLRAAQEGNRQRLERLLEGGAGQGAARRPHVQLFKMREADDPETFLTTFKATARTCRWLEAEWASHLLPLLTGEAQMAAHGLPTAAAGDYTAVVRAIKDRFGLKPEQHRRRFRALTYNAAARSYLYAQQLLDRAKRWLQPDEQEPGALLEMVVMEALTEGLPSRTSAWVQRHRPTTLAAAVALAEDHLAALPQPPPVPAPRRWLSSRPTERPVSAPRGRRPRQSPGEGGEPTPLTTSPTPQTGLPMPGEGCWRCGRPGHFRRECPLMEVGQVVRIAGTPTPFPGPGATYRIPTDASDRGLGAVLSQRRGEVDRPVLYLSLKLSDREARYSTVEKECLAFKWAVGTLQYYLLGRAFTLYSDHAPLQWLHRMKETNARITRWYLALQPFNFRVVHRPGAQMVVADFLSHSVLTTLISYTTPKNAATQIL